MARYKIKIQYDGANYCGWQIQRGKNTIQNVLEDAILPLNGNNRVVVTGAGRTDTGVHALGQVAHFDLDTQLDTNQLRKAINARMPNDIRIMHLEIINDDFHARFSAIKRYYHYQCYLGDNLLFRNQAWLISDVDTELLNNFARLIVGENNFLSFSKIDKTKKNTICNIYQSLWLKKQKMLTFKVCGNRFLHHLVRYLVGTMIAGAQGKISLEKFRNMLKNPQKDAKVYKAPAQGLILYRIDYD